MLRPRLNGSNNERTNKNIVHWLQKSAFTNKTAMRQCDLHTAMHKILPLKRLANDAWIKE